MSYQCFAMKMNVFYVFWIKLSLSVVNFFLGVGGRLEVFDSRLYTLVSLPGAKAVGTCLPWYSALHVLLACVRPWSGWLQILGVPNL